MRLEVDYVVGASEILRGQYDLLAENDCFELTRWDRRVITARSLLGRGALRG